MAYLKAKYPAQYMASLLSSVMDTKDRVPFYASAAEDMGIEVLPPCVNESAAGFAVVPTGEIRFGLTAVKGVGENAVATIITARGEDGPFESLWDFCRRVDGSQVEVGGAFGDPRHDRWGRVDPGPELGELIRMLE